MGITKKFLDDILEMNMHKKDEGQHAAESYETKEVKEGTMEDETEKVEESSSAAASVTPHSSDASAQVPDHLKENSDESEEDEMTEEKEKSGDDKNEMCEDKKADEDNAKIHESEDKEEDDEDEESEDMKEETEPEEMDESADMSDDEKKDVEEATKALTDGEELSESFKEKVSAIFEASVKRTSKKKILAEKEKLETIYEEKLKESEQEICETLVNKLDNYLNYVVEEWMKDNEVAIVSSVRSELTENFIMGLKGLFESNFIDIPESKVDVLSEQENKIKALETELNEEIKRSVELKNQHNNLKKSVMVNSMSDGMSKNESVKFAELCEGVSFSDEKSFEKKLQVIKESYFPNNKIDSKDISDNLLVEGGIFPQESAETKTEVDAFADVITKMVNAKNGRK
ncbi:MAG: hypothetical protein ACK5GV_08545 [Bacteroidota bacterium]|jgi:hypothetical protein